jgi:hypothetical protein
MSVELTLIQFTGSNTAAAMGAFFEAVNGPSSPAAITQTLCEALQNGMYQIGLDITEVAERLMSAGFSITHNGNLLAVTGLAVQ